jgi:hypothetical protein
MGKHLALFAVAALTAISSGLLSPEWAGAADSIYWSNYAGKISFAYLDGTVGGDINTTGATVAGPEGVAIDSTAGRIYWANTEANKISYGNLDGTGGADLFTGAATVSLPIGVAIDPTAGRVYWANGIGKISYAKLDGTGGADLFTGGATLELPAGVAVDPAGGRIYWANAGGNKISYAKLDGSGGGDVSTGAATVEGPAGVALDSAAGRIYWPGNGLAGKISFAKLDGSGGGDLPTGVATVEGPVGVAVDPLAGRIYWASQTANKISFAKLDGSGGGDLSTASATVENPSFVALLRAPSGTGAPSVSGDAKAGAPLSCSAGSWAPDLLPSFLYRAPRSFAYQWLRDGAEVGGAQEATFTPSEPGAYACRVTATNHAGAGAQTSGAVQVGGAVQVAKKSATGKARAARLAKVKDGKALLKLRCGGGGPCKGVIKLLVGRKLIGKARISIAAGKAKVIRVKLNRRGKKLLARRHRIKAKLKGRGVKHRTVVLK